MLGAALQSILPGRTVEVLTVSADSDFNRAYRRRSDARHRRALRVRQNCRRGVAPARLMIAY